MPANLENSVARGLEKVSPNAKKKKKVCVGGSDQECSNYWTVAFHMLVRLYSKSFNLGSSSKKTNNFQIYQIDLEKTEEPEIKLPISSGL